MESGGIPHQALRQARAIDTLTMSQPGFDEVFDVLHRHAPCSIRSLPQNITSD